MMVKTIVHRMMLTGLLLAISSPLSVCGVFEEFFSDSTLRLDYIHSGTKSAEAFTVARILREGPWPGSKTVLLDRLNLGEYMLRVYDVRTAAMIYSRGFSTIFNEWQTTDEAAQGGQRGFSETVRFPFPRNPVQVTISRRDKQMIFHEVWSTVITPAEAKDAVAAAFPVTTLMDNGPVDSKVDILILGDGYTKDEMPRFREDARYFNVVMFGTSPFKERKSEFNVRMIEVESAESGLSIPDMNISKNTALGMAYTTFGLPRYVLSESNVAIRNIAGAAPYDAICILLNDSRYGGGGIYNLYATTYMRGTVKGEEWTRDYMYVHEFGHSFAGLADEYYGSAIATPDMYSPKVEPWERNITPQTDPHLIKWRQLLSPHSELPTPWQKAAYDSLEDIWRKFDRLAPDFWEKWEPVHQAEMKILRESPERNTVGAFEGGGYQRFGMYRPSLNCRMFSLSLSDFDPVCRAAINEVIDSYVGK